MATNLQFYGLTGRKTKPNYVDIINAQTPYLSRKKAIKDEEAYRNKVLALQESELSQTSVLARERLEAEKKASTRAMGIGLGQLGIETYTGRKRDQELKAIIEGATGGKGAATTTPSKAAYGLSDAYDASGNFAADIGDKLNIKPSFFSKEGITDVSSWKAGLSKWGPIAVGALTGGTVGAELGEKFLPFGGERERRIIGGAATAGGLSYLASGDPYTAAISTLLGGAFGGFS